MQKRLSRRLLLQVLLMMIGLLLISYFSVRQILHGYILTRLQHDTESLISALEHDAEQGWRLNPNQVPVIYKRVRTGHYFRIDAADQSLVSRSVFDETFPLPPKLTEGAAPFTISGLGKENWLVWFQVVSKNGHELKLFVAEDLNPIQQQLFRYLGYAFLLVMSLIGLLIFLQQRALTSAFEIFELLRKNLSSIRTGEIETLGGGVPKEISPLIDEIGGLVEQLRHRTLRTRHAIGNLAHELKRPMQRLSIQSEIGNTQLREPSEEIRYIIDRELRRARISGAKDVGGGLSLTDELPALIQIMGQIYPHIKIDFSLGHTDRLTLDRDDILELVGNLLDNACKFAKREVRVNSELKDQWLHLTVEDDGPGLPTLAIERIGQRGVRLDENISGHGLGLSICKDILESYSGSIEFSVSSLGGLKVAAKLPLKTS